MKISNEKKNMNESSMNKRYDVGGRFFFFFIKIAFETAVLKSALEVFYWREKVASNVQL